MATTRFDNTPYAADAQRSALRKRAAESLLMQAAKVEKEERYFAGVTDAARRRERALSPLSETERCQCESDRERAATVVVTAVRPSPVLLAPVGLYGRGTIAIMGMALVAVLAAGFMPEWADVIYPGAGLLAIPLAWIATRKGKAES